MYFYILLIAFINGILEFAPVSSSAHTFVFMKFLDIKIDRGFINAVNFGTSCAALHYYKDNIYSFLHSFYDLLNKKDNSASDYVKYLIMHTFASICICFFASLVFGDFFTINAIPIALILGGLILYITDQVGKDDKEVTLLSIILSALCQSLSSIPGVSRLGGSLIGMRLSGVDVNKAYDFAVFSGIPIMIMVSIHGFITTSSDLISIIIGNLISFIFGAIGIRICKKCVEKYGLSIFAFYRITVGIIMVLLYI